MINEKELKNWIVQHANNIRKQRWTSNEPWPEVIQEWQRGYYQGNFTALRLLWNEIRDDKQYIKIGLFKEEV